MRCKKNTQVPSVMSYVWQFGPRVRFRLRFVASEKPQTFDLDCGQKGKRSLTGLFLQRLLFQKKIARFTLWLRQDFLIKRASKQNSTLKQLIFYGNLTDDHENTFFSRKFTILPTPSRLWCPTSHGECLILLPKPYKLGHQAGLAVTDRRARAGLRMQ